MKPVHNWRAVLLHAWSARMMYLALLVIVIEPVLDLLLSLSDGLSFWLQLVCRTLSGLLLCAGIYARTIVQKKLHPKNYSGDDYAD